VLQGYKKGLEIEQAVMELFKETYGKRKKLYCEPTVS